MNDYYFSFGFMDPSEASHLGWGGPDFSESSEGVWIAAESEEKAVEWGREVAERFIATLFKNQSVSWKEHHYVHGIFQKTFDLLSEEAKKRTPRIQYGKWPNFQEWIAARERSIKNFHSHNKNRRV
jgi:hypothetical protein